MKEMMYEETPRTSV